MKVRDAALTYSDISEKQQVSCCASEPEEIYSQQLITFYVTQTFRATKQLIYKDTLDVYFFHCVALHHVQKDKMALFQNWPDWGSKSLSFASFQLRNSA